MKILVAYDPPYSNTRLLDKAIENAKLNNANVYLVTSLYDGHDAAPEKVDRTEEELARARKIFEAENLSVESHILVRHNSPGEDVVIFAKENGIDEIIIQIKKTSKVGKLMRGSNAQHIILNAPCTVLSVR